MSECAASVALVTGGRSWRSRKTAVKGSAAVDFIVWDGLEEERDAVEIIFLDVKTGQAWLNDRQRRIQDAARPDGTLVIEFPDSES